MAADRVEREVLIEAPIEVVWAVITEPEHVKQWFADEAEIELRPGGRGELTFAEKATKKPIAVPIRIEAVEPPRRLAYRWMLPAGEEPRPGNSILVEFILAQEGENTRLQVVESGLQRMPWSDSEKQSYSADHADGWATHVESLRKYAPGVQASALS